MSLRSYLILRECQFVLSKMRTLAVKHLTSVKSSHGRGCEVIRLIARTNGNVRRTVKVQCDSTRPCTNRNYRHDDVAVPYCDSENKGYARRGPSVTASLSQRDDLHAEDDDERRECQRGITQCLRRSVSCNR